MFHHFGGALHHAGLADAGHRIYPLDGGLAFAPNKAMYSPGHFEGETVALSCNAFLIQRGDEWLLWDTGISQDIFHELGGEVIAHGIRGIVARPLTHQLAELGLVPEDVSKVILSHAHFDHIGNSGLFSKSLVVCRVRRSTLCSVRTMRTSAISPICTKHCKRPTCNASQETLIYTATNRSV